VPLLAFDPYRFPEVARTQLRDLLERWVDFRLVAAMPRDEGPVLQVGAVEVRSGEFRRFDSRRGEITVDTVLASAAVPTLFRAVETQDGAYWDGVFSENPPIRDLPSLDIDSIWIVQLFPRSIASEPRSPGAIADRRAELTANLSLEQEIDAIERINGFVRAAFAIVLRHEPDRRLLRTRLGCLVRHIRVRDHCARHAAHVCESRTEHLLGELRLIDPSCNEDGKSCCRTNLSRLRSDVGILNTHRRDDMDGTARAGHRAKRRVDVVESVCPRELLTNSEHVVFMQAVGLHFIR